MPNGRYIKKGDLIKRTKYGKTLKKIAEGGPDVFYKGKMAEQVIKTVKITLLAVRSALHLVLRFNETN